MTTQPTGPVARRPIWRQVFGDVRWSFIRPWTWLSGVAFNLVLSLLFLVAMPLTGRPHQDWAILVGSYFAVFILADVTTTNVLGADAQRVRRALENNFTLRRILFIKNVTLLVIVGLPTLIATAILTIYSESDYRLLVTLPGVAFPILTWVGVGNIVSVALCVPAVPLRQRWQQRHQRNRTLRWLFALVLPYVLYLIVSPVEQLPRIIARHLPAVPHTTWSRGLVLTATGLGLWVLGTAIALAVARHHEIRLDDPPVASALARTEREARDELPL